MSSQYLRITVGTKYRVCMAISHNSYRVDLYKLNAGLLTSHLNGLSPVCDIMCLFKSLGFMHTFLQISQTRFLLVSTTTPLTRNGRLLSKQSLAKFRLFSVSNFWRFFSRSWMTDSSTSSPASNFLLRMSGYRAAMLLCSIPCTENWWYSNVLFALKDLLQTCTGKINKIWW